ncbi:3-oxoacyl-ACP reductase FabG [Streptomyces sp. NPDC048710]|uniref:3-oxoacyl-ACP reductase FabG n=1 Tax=unclassified Streptomyces TaxID=2593676 RepID=UPI00371144BA
MTRSVLVTGGNRGIGLAIAREMAAAGDAVAVTCRSGEAPDGLFGVKCDVTSAEDVDSAFAKVEAEQGPVEVLVSNAGITRDKILAVMREEDFDAVLDANLTGAYRVAKRAVKNMIRARSGRLVFVSSVVAFNGQSGQSNYAASKAGLVGFARSLARELGPRNITANVVAPGFVDTDMTAGLSDRIKAAAKERIPLGRTASPEEIAKVVRFLAGADAGYVTGAVVPVDGGLAMGL